MEVKYLGGEVGDVGELYSHMPVFKEKEDVLVFLKKNEQDKEYRILKGEEGKISVFADEKSGEKVTSSNISLKDNPAVLWRWRKNNRSVLERLCWILFGSI